MTEEQYNLLKDIITEGRSSFFPREVDTMFQVFQEIENWQPSCKTCPGNVMIVRDRLEPKVKAFRDQLQKETKI